MSAFNNHDHVANQAAQQNVQGSMYNAPIYNVYPSSVSLPIRPAGRHDAEELDPDILASLAFPEMLERRANVEHPHPETCQWIFARQEYQTWRETHRGLLWIKGKPGAGKSTVMSHLYSSLVEDFQQQQAICLEFFFSARGTELQRTPLGMLRSLMSQLFQQDQNIRAEIRKAYQVKCGPFKGVLQTEWQRGELEKVFQRVVLKASQQRQMFIFIDALDESGEQDARTTAAYFHQVNDQCAKAKALIRICMSCRHYPIASMVPGHEIWVETNNYDDISRYIRDHLNLEFFLLDTDNSDRDAWFELEKSIADQAQGVFIWVCLVVPLVQKAMIDGQSPQEVLEWLRAVPDDLAAVYRHVLTQVIGLRTIERTLLLFVWTILVFRPLRLTELSYVMANKEFPLNALQWYHRPIASLEPFERLKRQVTAFSGGLIEIMSDDSSGKLSQKQSDVNVTHQSVDGGVIEIISDDPSGILSQKQLHVSVIHQSVNDFFSSEGFSILASLQQPRPATSPATYGIGHNWPQTTSHCHALIYWTCLRRLIEQHEQDNDSRWTSTTCDENGDVSHSPGMRIPADMDFLNYARDFIFVHRQEFHSDAHIPLDMEIQILDTVSVALLDCTVEGDSALHLQLHSEYSILHIAAVAGLTPLLEQLIRDKSQIHVSDRAGYTPLHHAARHGDFASFKLLVEAGANIHQRSLHGETPLSLIMNEKSEHIFAWLFNRISSDPSQKDNLTELIAEQWETIVQKGDIKMAALLLRHGINVNMPLALYGSALRLAATKKDSKMVRFLASRGAKANTAMDVVRPMLQRVIESAGTTEMLQLLLQAGADVNSADRESGTPLRAACYARREACVQILLHHGADVNRGAFNLGTPLQIAAKQGSIHIVQMLIHAGANVNLVSGGYGTPLENAAEFGHGDVVQLLLDAGADACETEGSWDTALERALREDHDTIAALLLSRFPDLIEFSGQETTTLRDHMLGQAGAADLATYVLNFSEASMRTFMATYTHGIEPAQLISAA